MVTHFIVQSFNVLLLTVVDTSCSLKDDLVSKFIRSELMNWLKMAPSVMVSGYSACVDLKTAV